MYLAQDIFEIRRIGSKNVAFTARVFMMWVCKETKSFVVAGVVIPEKQLLRSVNVVIRICQAVN